MEHRLPKAVSRKLNPAEQAAFVKAHETLPAILSRPPTMGSSPGDLGCDVWRWF